MERIEFTPSNARADGPARFGWGRASALPYPHAKEGIMCNKDKLPLMCMAHIPGTNKTIAIYYGERGYYEVPFSTSYADEWNEKHGVTKGQVEAMLTGSMFGWDVPGADPDNYNLDGTMRKRELDEETLDAQDVISSLKKA
jgi:hypothetical protein